MHSATKYLSGHSDVLLGAIVTADDELYACSRGGATCRRDARARSRPGWRCAACAPCTCGSSAPRPTPELVTPAGGAPRGRESATRASAAIIAIEVAQGAMAADLLRHKTRAVGARHEPRRCRVDLGAPPRWKAEPATIPEGLVRLSVGIEDVDDLWNDLGGASTA